MGIGLIVPLRASTAKTEMFAESGYAANKKFPAEPNLIEAGAPTGKGAPGTTVSAFVVGSTENEKIPGGVYDSLMRGANMNLPEGLGITSKLYCMPWGGLTTKNGDPGISVSAPVIGEMAYTVMARPFDRTLDA